MVFPRKAPPVIETARLRLRPPEERDAEAVFTRYAGDPEVTRYVSFPRHLSVEASRAFVRWSRAEWDRRPAGPYLVFERDGVLLLGGTGLLFEAPARAEVGYVLARDAWGRGLATEALRAMLELAPTLGVERLQANCHPDHRASRRVLEKCGFECEGILHRHLVLPNLEPGAPSDVLSYAILFER